MRKKKNGERFSFADEPMPIKQPQPYKDDAPQLLLNWLLKWRKQTIKMNEILVYGPRPTMRKRESAIGPIETLVRHGWLRPLKTRRSNMLEWQIIRQPIVHPIIES